MTDGPLSKMRTEEDITVAPSKSSMYNLGQDTVKKSDFLASKLISDRISKRQEIIPEIQMPYASVKSQHVKAKENPDFFSKGSLFWGKQFNTYRDCLTNESQAITTSDVRKTVQDNASAYDRTGSKNLKNVKQQKLRDLLSFRTCGSSEQDLQKVLTPIQDEVSSNPSPTISHDDRRVPQSGGCFSLGKDITRTHFTRQSETQFVLLQLSQFMIGLEMCENFQNKVGNILVEMITVGVELAFGKSLFLLKYLLHAGIARAALFLDTTLKEARKRKTLAFVEIIDKDFDCVSCVLELGHKLIQLTDQILGIRTLIGDYMVAPTKKSDEDDEMCLGLATCVLNVFKLKVLLCGSPQYVSNRNVIVIYEGKESEHLKAPDQLQLQSKTDEVCKLVVRMMKFHTHIDCKGFQKCPRIFAEMLKQNKFRDKTKIREFVGQMEDAFDVNIAEDTETHSQNKNMLNVLEGKILATLNKILATFHGGYETVFKQTVGQRKDCVGELSDVSEDLLAEMLCHHFSSFLKCLLKMAGSRTETVVEKHFEQIQDKIQQVYGVGIAHEAEIRS